MKRATLAIVAAFAAIVATAETSRTATENWTRNRIAEATNGLRRVDAEARPLPAYLHAYQFADAYPEDAAWYYQFADMGGACSSVRNGNDYARNFDLTYDERAEFVVEMIAGPGRLASVGVANVGTNLTEAAVTSGARSRFYKALPGASVDGINSEGVVCSINLVPTNGAPWETKGGRDLNALGVVRFVLDTATSASNAAAAVASRCYIPDALKRKGYSAHFMLADERETWIVEDGTAHPATGRAVLTNYRLFADNDPYGTGYERFNILAAGGNITSAWFRAAYRRPFSRPTEFAAPGVGTHSETNALLAWADANIPQGAPESLTRNGHSWQTVHTSRFDISNRVLRVTVQEQPDWYTFQVPSSGANVDAYTKAETDAKLAGKLDGPAVWPMGTPEESGKAADAEVTGQRLNSVSTAAQEAMDKANEVERDMYRINALKANRVDGAISGNIATLTADGDLADGGIAATNVATKTDIPDVSEFLPMRSPSIPDCSVRWDGFHFMWGYYLNGSFYQTLDYDTQAGFLQSLSFAGFMWILDSNGSSLQDALDGKANQDNTYTVGEVDSLFVRRTEISETDPIFSSAVLQTVVASLSTNITAEVYIAATNACANLGIDPSLIPQGGTLGTVGGLLLALAAAVALLSKKTKLLKSDGTAEDDFATNLLGKPVAKEAVRYAFDSPTSSTTTTGTVETTAVTANSNTVASVTIPAAASGNTPSLAITVPDALGSSDVRDLIVYAVNADTANDCPIGIVGGTPVPQDGSEAKVPKGSRGYIAISKMPTTGEWFIQAVKLTAAA